MASISEKLEQVTRLLNEINILEGNDPEWYGYFMERLSPAPVPVKAAKRKRKLSKKSARASGMAERLKENRETQRQAVGTGDADLDLCQRPGCGLLADVNEHHMTTHPDYHEFQPAAQAAEVTGG